MNSYKLVDKKPVKIEMKEWIELMLARDGKNIVVKTTEVNDISISTVFLGIGVDINALFETMVFGRMYDQFRENYGSWEEAELGHDRVVEMVKNKIK